MLQYYSVPLFKIPIVHPLQAFFVTIQKAILEGLLSGAGGGGEDFWKTAF